MPVSYFPLVYNIKNCVIFVGFYNNYNPVKQTLFTLKLKQNTYLYNIVTNIKT